jgi:DUF971 family protein
MTAPHDATRPVRLAASSPDQALTAEWADGHVSVYSYEGLRRACPCAECRGHENMGAPVDPVVFHLPSLMTYGVAELRPAGHYALQIVWEDGHASGLWRWDVLRAICPCDACASGEPAR